MSVREEVARRAAPRAARALVLVAATAALFLAACKEAYRVGQLVWVDWEGRTYPAYVVEQRGAGRFRVHFDGYDTRWDEDVTVDRIRGRVTGPAIAPPPPEKVARELGLRAKSSQQADSVSPYKVGDRVRVRWRGSEYAATVLAVIGPDRFVVHYDGHESAWDETVPAERIAGRK